MVTTSAEYEPVVPRRISRHRIRDIDYAVHEWGTRGKPLLILLHGWGDTGASFQFLVDELQHEHYVIAPDWRGFGESGRNGGAYWFPDYLADLHALLTDFSPDQAAPLVGHSMGANAATLYAGIFPERVSALVNVEGFGLADSDPASAATQYRRWIEAESLNNGYADYASFDELVPRILKRSPRMDRSRAMYVARQWARMDDDGRVRLKADPAHRWPNAVLYRRTEAEACWRKISAPVLLVSGEETSFTAAAQAWHDGARARQPFARAAAVRLAEGGHMLHFEQPARLAHVIEEFLAGGRVPDPAL
jgi:pimeloyl-ACP methyl ester carboxylesterase